MTLRTLGTNVAQLNNAFVRGDGGPTWYGSKNGLKYDGTDETTTVNTILAAIQTFGGGTLVIDGAVRCNGAITPAYAGTSTPTQKPIRITSPGAASANGRWSGSPLNGGGGTLDLRYDGTDTLHPAKIDTRGAGRLEIDHLNIISGGTDDFPFLQTTNTSVHIHHNFVQGNTGKSGTACKQDVFILGGTSTTSDNGANAPFQGYGSKVHDNFFDHIRRGVWGRAYCNSVPVEDNTFSTTCGNDGTGGGSIASGTANLGAAIEFTGNSTAGNCTGNLTRGNTIEVTGYKYGVAASWAIANYFGPDGIWDPGSIYVAAVYFDPTTALYNQAVRGYANDNYPFVLDSGLLNRAEQAAQSRMSFQSQPTFIKPGSLAPQVFATGGIGWQTAAASGDLAGVKVTGGASGSPSYPEVLLTTTYGTTVTDLVTTNGSDVVTSAAATFTRQHQYAPIKATGIPANTVIIRYIDAHTVQLSAACTATATGITAQFGTGSTGAGTQVDEIGFNRRHIQARGNAGTVTANTAAGTGATATTSNNPTDTAFRLTLTTGTGPTAGQLVTVACSITWNNFAKYALTPCNAAAAAAMSSAQLYCDNPSRTNWFLYAGVAPPASTVLIFDVIAVS